MWKVKNEYRIFRNDLSFPFLVRYFGLKDMNDVKPDIILIEGSLP